MFAIIFTLDKANSVSRISLTWVALTFQPSSLAAVLPKKRRLFGSKRKDSIVSGATQTTPVLQTRRLISVYVFFPLLSH